MKKQNKQINTKTGTAGTRENFQVLGCFEVSSRLAVVVSRGENGDVCLAQRLTFDDNGGKTHVFKRQSTLRLSPEQFRKLTDVFVDIVDDNL